MGLFGVSKILVLIVIIVVVWYGFKLVARRNQHVGDRRSARPIGSTRPEPPDSKTQDMESCAVCGTFVPNASARACGRKGCPYPE